MLVLSIKYPCIEVLTIEQCRLVHDVKDKCAFIKANCPDEEAGLLSYLQFYYCTLNKAQPVAFTLLVLWLGLLFSTIGIAASDFFCINLSTIASILGMSESMAGVTFLAFGNGSPDVFSTFAAMSTHSGSLAVGELIGAAGFITAVVAGSMALVRPFKVAKKSFVRDVGFFAVAASFSMVFLADGKLRLWECITMVVFYVFYVVTVVIWHWYLDTRRKRRERDAAARGHFLAVDGEELEVEEENEDEDGAASGRSDIMRGVSVEDFANLERGNSPRIAALDEDDDEANRDKWLAEMRSNMRVRRATRGSRRNTITPIRPSLVGALEFRAVLSSLQKSRTVRSIPINLRRYSDDPSYTLAQQTQNLSATSNPDLGSMHRTATDPAINTDGDNEQASRRRAVSTNDISNINLDSSILDRNSAPRVDLLASSPPTEDASRSRAGTTTSTASTLETLNSPRISLSPPPSERGSRSVSPAPPRDRVSSGAHLAPPSNTSYFSNRYHDSPEHSPRLTPHQIPRLEIPGSDFTDSPTMTPFPDHFSDDPNSVVLSPRPGSLMLPSPSLGTESQYRQHLDYEDNPPKPLRWWPYKILPAPDIVASTLFPTIYFWKEKNFWEKMLGVVAAPSVFLLAVTLPVVETEKDDNDDDFSEVADHYIPSPELGRKSSQPATDTAIQVLDHHANAQAQGNSYGGHGSSATIATSVEQHHHHNHPHNAAPAIHGASESKDWNRWLVSTQIFTAPLFTTFIIWANISDGFTKRSLAKAILCSLLGSLIAFGILVLTTSPSKPPKLRFLLCFVGFVVSITWISTIANEVVGVLKAFGVILGISDAILGLTIFAVGNSLGDLVADITVARLGYPVMALSACFGGPMLNILLGIGVSGMYMTIKEGSHRHEKHPNRPMKYKPYHIDVSSTLVISGVTLLITLLGLLIVVPLNKWKMDKRIGWGLVILWCISTLGNVIVEITGWGGDMS